MVQNAHHAGVGFGADGPSEALSEFHLHIRDNDRPDIILQGGILFPFRFTDRIRDRKRQPHNDERRHHIAGKVHTFPAGTRCEQHGILRLLELMDDVLRVPPYFHQGKRQPVLYLIVNSTHKGIGGKEHQSVAMSGFHQPADLLCQTLSFHFAAHLRFRQVAGDVKKAVFFIVKG